MIDPRRLESVFDRAVELPQADRVDFVRGACGADRELQEAVFRLLAAHVELDQSTFAAPPFEHANRAERSLRPGDALGPFVVERQLGRGGMGEVWSARDERLGRTVALKLVRADRTGPTAKERLKREAMSLARLSHPNVIQIHEVGDAGDDLFLAMEFVDGVDLQHKVPPGLRPWREVVGLYIQAARGLAAAHAVGLVHRDFKPANVLVGDDGRVRVADFGLAVEDHRGDAEPRAAASAAGTPSSDERARLQTITVRGSIIGTVPYMSPEQLHGEPVDARSDQFSFCLALFESLTGRAAFGGDTARARAEAIDRGVITALPAGLSLPSWLLEAISRGLAASPTLRHDSMDALARLLAAGIGDPEMDPALDRVPRSRILLFGPVTAVVVAGLILRRGLTVEALPSPRNILIIGAGVLAAVSLFLWLRRRTLTARLTRLSARVVWLLGATQLADRTLGLLRGWPSHVTLANDLFCFAVISTVAAFAIDPVFYVGVAAFGIASVVGTLVPGAIALAYAFGVITTVFGIIALWRRKV
ncbi:MAG: protein kinase [Deltaproteobacteria bacterium]|nr:protein kinase [Deltaproteobacteria bacterium]